MERAKSNYVLKVRPFWRPREYISIDTTHAIAMCKTD